MLNRSTVNTITTVIGATAGILQASQIDTFKLLHGDHQEISKLVGALTLAVLGYFAKQPVKNDNPDSPADPKK